MITADPHPLLDLHVSRVTWPAPLSEIAATPHLDALCAADADTPFDAADEEHKRHVRDLLRHGGFKPAGRSKPCWEYMRSAAAKGKFPRINVAVDLTNAATLHGALPVSTVDLERAHGPFRVGIAESGARYVFNASDQEIDLSGLLCLFDAEGPCANSVKDSHRTKTHDGSTSTLTVVWGTVAVPGRGAALADWFDENARLLGGTVERL
ncbi:MAG: DNA/RNA-binding domain of Phe-tRNA-synthetase-like protein [Myxococcota bacterium]|jgi:DNA/RNA-binding domain of Phe-tRNA-synthetase-like protein